MPLKYRGPAATRLHVHTKELPDTTILTDTLTEGRPEALNPLAQHAKNEHACSYEHKSGMLPRVAARLYHHPATYVIAADAYSLICNSTAALPDAMAIY